jgi:hypothetical protein
MKRVFVSCAAACLAIAALALPTSAQAGDGGAVAAGVIGGLAIGAMMGSAAANNAPYYGGYNGPYYYQPAPAYYGPSCYWQRQRVWDGFGWRWSRVRVCN